MQELQLLRQEANQQRCSKWLDDASGRSTVVAVGQATPAQHSAAAGQAQGGPPQPPASSSNVDSDQVTPSASSSGPHHMNAQPTNPTEL